MVVDKTVTLTEGKPKLVTVKAAQNYTELDNRTTAQAVARRLG